jgi:hypothetical protein
MSLVLFSGAKLVLINNLLLLSHSVSLSHCTIHPFSLDWLMCFYSRIITFLYVQQQEEEEEEGREGELV